MVRTVSNNQPFRNGTPSVIDNGNKHMRSLYIAKRMLVGWLVSWEVVTLFVTEHLGHLCWDHCALPHPDSSIILHLVLYQLDSRIFTHSHAFYSEHTTFVLVRQMNLVTGAYAITDTFTGLPQVHVYSDSPNSIGIYSRTSHPCIRSTHLRIF